MTKIIMEPKEIMLLAVKHIIIKFDKFVQIYLSNAFLKNIKVFLIAKFLSRSDTRKLDFNP